MDEQERDNLLIRMDERLKGIKNGNEGDIPEIKEHLKCLNTIVQNNRRRITRNEVMLYFLLGGSAAGVGITKILGVI